MQGKLQFLTFKEASKLGDYDEMPMLPPDRDPQMFLSTNSVPQPFHVVHEKDTLILQMSGAGKLEFHDSSIRYFNVRVGDFVYIPAGVPTRFFPSEPGAQYRLRAREPGAEGVIFFSDHADCELFRHMWDTRETSIHQGYLDAVEEFNRLSVNRTCLESGVVHDPIDVSRFRWADIAEKLAH